MHRRYQLSVTLPIDVLEAITVTFNETERSVSEIVEDALRKHLQMTVPKRHHFPHARGDGPFTLLDCFHLYQFSPRPWGWSEKTHRDRSGEKIFPTPVGMVRDGRKPGLG